MRVIAASEAEYRTLGEHTPLRSGGQFITVLHPDASEEMPGRRALDFSPAIFAPPVCRLAHRGSALEGFPTRNPDQIRARPSSSEGCPTTRLSGVFDNPGACDGSNFFDWGGGAGGGGLGHPAGRECSQTGKGPSSLFTTILAEPDFILNIDSNPTAGRFFEHSLIVRQRRKLWVRAAELSESADSRWSASTDLASSNQQRPITSTLKDY